MEKIANPQELASELRSLIQKVQEPNPSREELSSDLKKLAAILTKFSGWEAHATLVDCVEAITHNKFRIRVGNGSLTVDLNGVIHALADTLGLSFPNVEPVLDNALLRRGQMVSKELMNVQRDLNRVLDDVFEIAADLEKYLDRESG